MIGVRRKFHAYLASPYSHESSAVRERRFEDVAKCAAHFMRQEYILFCPITHSHPIQKHGTPGGWGFWRHVDETAIENCEQLWVLCIEGWKESEGVQDEIKFAKNCFIPIHYIQEIKRPDGTIGYVKTPFVPLAPDMAIKQVREAIEEIGGRRNEAGGMDRFDELLALLAGRGFLGGGEDE
jgi:hypothetical protein